MNVEVIKSVGAVVGLIGGLLTLFERILSIRAKSRKQREKTEQLSATSNVALLPRNSATSGSFLVREEIFVVLAAALLVNFVSLCLSTRLTSILYLDMTGTALAALILGPWYGAIAGLLSNGLVNWLLYPGPDGDVIVFPWALVNVCGGLLWGFLGRARAFSSFMENPGPNLSGQVLHLLKFGVFGAAVMAVPGTVVQIALGQQGILALDPEIATALNRFLVGSIDNVRSALLLILSDTWSERISKWIVCWAQNTARYIPDKTLSFAIAVVMVKSAFPLFERELIHSRTNTVPSRPQWLEPMLFLLVLMPYTAVLVFTPHFSSHAYRSLWLTPMVIGLLGVWLECSRAIRKNDRYRKKAERQLSYKRARELLPRDAATHPGPNFALACLSASLLFVLALPTLVTNYFRVAFNFLCLVYGFQLALLLYGIAVGQNLAIRATKHQSPKRDAAKAG